MQALDDRSTIKRVKVCTGRSTTVIATHFGQWGPNCTSGSTQRLKRCLGNSENDEERDRRGRDEIVRRRQVAAGHTDQPCRDEGREAAENRNRGVVAD